MNNELAKILYEMAELLEMKNVPFKPRAYEKASYSLSALEEDVADIYKKGGKKALEKIPGVGRGIAERIEEYLKYRRIKDYQTLKKAFPIDISGLTAIEGVGPKMIKTLYEKLRVKNVKDLEKAARSGKIHKLAHFGTRSEEKILKGIEFHKKGHGRFLLGEVLPLARSIKERLAALNAVENIELAGSLRRGQETVGDIDILIVSASPAKVMDFFSSLKEVAHVYAKGNTKTSVRLRSGIDADLRVVPKDSFGAALQYFTGNKDHNVALRKIAIKKGYKLNEYGIYKGKRRIAGESEEGVYRALGLSFVPSEARMNWGEIELAQKNNFPKLVEVCDLKGDLQTQTSWTDGSNSILEMAYEAERLGHEYIAITDHTKSLAMTGGPDEKKILRQMAEIDRINHKLKTKNSKLKILKGAEVNILKDGSLDISDKVLAKLDVAGAAVHSHFNLPRLEQTKRITRAMQNPHIDILFHPTGRIINRREPYEVDMSMIIETAKKTGTILEIDAHPWRLDLKDEHIREAREAGVKMVINPDAHSTSELSYLEYGVFQARRAWCQKNDIINTKPLKDFLKALK